MENTGRRTSQHKEQEAGVGGAPEQDAYVAERLDHLGIVAGVCREIGLAAWLDAQDEQSHERVGVGTATVAMILNGLGFSNRRLYLVPQFFASKAVERLLGPGIAAEDRNDDCLGRALDWLYAHDPTTLFAGIAVRARQAFGIRARQVHVDTTSFAVTGEYESDLDAHPLAVTYGYSRDHRADLKQWDVCSVSALDVCLRWYVRDTGRYALPEARCKEAPHDSRITSSVCRRTSL